MKQDRKPRNKPMQQKYGYLIFDKGGKDIYNGARTVSSINSGRKTGQLHVKE